MEPQSKSALPSTTSPSILSTTVTIVPAPVDRKVRQLLDISDINKVVVAVDRTRVRGFSLGWVDEKEIPLLLRFSDETTLMDPLPTVVASNNTLESGFKVEPECRLFNPKTFKLNIQKDTYKEQYSNSKHLIWVGSFPKSEEFFIVTLLDVPSERENLYHALEHSRKGIEEFEIVCLKKKDINDNTRMFEKALQQHFLSASFYSLKTTHDIVQDIVQIESKHKLIVQHLIIGVIYAQKGQKKSSKHVS